MKDAPKLKVRIHGGAAWCGRCGQPIGVAFPHPRTLPPGTIRYGLERQDSGVALVDVARHSWDLVDGDHVLRRQRRRAQPGLHPFTGRLAMRGDVVRCPNERCSARQVVPEVVAV
jgi:hypothetical protein